MQSKYDLKSSNTHTTIITALNAIKLIAIKCIILLLLNLIYLFERLISFLLKNANRSFFNQLNISEIHHFYHLH